LEFFKRRDGKGDRSHVALADMHSRAIVVIL